MTNEHTTTRTPDDWDAHVAHRRRLGETTRQAEARLLHGPDRPESAQPITAQSVTSLTIGDGDDAEPATVAVYPVSRLTFGVNLHSLSTRPDLAGVWIDAGTAEDGTTSVRVLTGDSSGTIPTPEVLQECAHMLRIAADAVAHASGLDLEVDQ